MSKTHDIVSKYYESFARLKYTPTNWFLKVQKVNNRLYDVSIQPLIKLPKLNEKFIKSLTS